MWKRIGLILTMVCLLAGTGLSVTSTVMASQSNASEGYAANANVHVIPVQQPIESGLEKFMERAFREAEEAGAQLIVLEINTPGGSLDNTMTIGDLIQTSKIPTLAYIKGEAASAGSYISLCADQIVMELGSMIGASAIVDGNGQLVDNPKLIAAWSSMMRAAAEKNNRNGDIAAGMVESNLIVDMKAIQKTKQQGEIISLTAKEADALGYADQIVQSLDEAIAFAGIENPNVTYAEQSMMEKLAGWLTNPVVSTLLIFIGIAGIAIELLVPGFGFPGILGVLSFGLYFLGNYVAGFAEKESVFLFILGIILLVCELFVPSFGVLGILGSVSLIGGVVMAAMDTSSAVISLSVAFVAALVVVIIVARIFKHRGIWNRFILRDSLSTEQGFISAGSQNDLLNKQGVSVTPLRPSGIVLIEGQRIDVVTDGTFINANRPIVVAKIDGTRVIVKELTE